VNAAYRSATTSRSVTRYGVGMSITSRVAGARLAGHWSPVFDATVPTDMRISWGAEVVINGW
jgi:hypothetical protein